MTETYLGKWVPGLEQRPRREGDVCESSVSRCIRHRGCGRDHSASTERGGQQTASNPALWDSDTYWLGKGEAYKSRHNKPARTTGRIAAESQGKQAFVGRGGHQGKIMLKG